MTTDRIYISRKPDLTGRGGGANTFSYNLHQYLRRESIFFTPYLLLADKAIVIAFQASLWELWLAKKKGCFIIHRLDEHFVENEEEGRRRRHEKIKRINAFADVTVFQSEFVKNNVLPYLKTKRWCIIRNGGDPKVFYDDQKSEREYVGHVTNSVADKKRLDLLERAILKFPHEKFLLVGSHKDSSIHFEKYPNVTLTGRVDREAIASCYRKMKCLYFPSENDPCPNTAVEAVLSSVPVCYNPAGGTVEVVKNCGLPLEQFETLLREWPVYRQKCLSRSDLYFESVAEQYLSLR
ncbi:MAG: glycosyltransferase family 1 protein [Candidatus Omnitrophica bacterium]|nr:glycosyltransferase family 1 protein [Candidatus Omnitrophota bacterium]